MALTKIINDENKDYRPVLTDKLVLDAKPTVNSFNAITSDAVARAIAGASGEVPAVEEGDNGKVLTAIYDEGGAAVEWADAPVSLPDMTGQDGKILGAVDVEGTTEAQWINPPESFPSVTGNANKVLTVNAGATGVEWASTQLPEEKSLASANNTINITEGATTVSIDVANPLPSTAVADANKVLTVNAQGDGYGWVAPAQTIYTAGVGIDITAEVVSADIDDVTIKRASTTTTTDINGSGSGSYASNGGYIVDPGQDIVSKFYLLMTEGGSATIHIPGNTYYFNSQPSSDVILAFTSYYQSTSDMQILSGYATALTTTLDPQTYRYWVDEQDIVLEGPAADAPSANNWIHAQAVLSRAVAGIGISTKSNQDVSTQWAFASSYGATGHLLQYAETVTSNKIAVANPIPTYDTTTDVGKVLQVTNSGLAWVSLT